MKENNISNVNVLGKVDDVGKRKFSDEHICKLKIARAKQKISDETKQKIRNTLLGRKLSEEHKRNVGLGGLGRKHSDLTKMKQSLSKIGKNNPNWSGGMTSLQIQIRGRAKYKKWANECKKRDNFLCQICKEQKKELHTHHLYSFSNKLKENNIATVDQALKCESLWRLEDGITMCLDCHERTYNYLNKGRQNISPSTKLKGGIITEK